MLIELLVTGQNSGIFALCFRNEHIFLFFQLLCALYCSGTPQPSDPGEDVVLAVFLGCWHCSL